MDFTLNRDESELGTWTLFYTLSDGGRHTFDYGCPQHRQAGYRRLSLSGLPT